MPLTCYCHSSVMRKVSPQFIIALGEKGVNALQGMVDSQTSSGKSVPEGESEGLKE